MDHWFQNNGGVFFIQQQKLVSFQTHRFQLVLCLIELHDEIAIVDGLVLDHHLQTHRETLQVVVDSLQSRVKLEK